MVALLAKALDKPPLRLRLTQTTLATLTTLGNASALLPPDDLGHLEDWGLQLNLLSWLSHLLGVLLSPRTCLLRDGTAVCQLQTQETTHVSALHLT